MNLRLRHLKLEVITETGPFGASLPFKKGLNVVRADNSGGKSTCMKAIVYALGLERMYGPANHAPLPPSMTHLIEEGSQEIPVLESSIYLELENSAGEVVTIFRKVAGTSERDWRLITLFEGPALTKPGQYSSRSLYVRDPGAATREDGFHSYLEKFLGWRLPEVVKFNGDVVPLYLEAVLPLFYVEQKFGWAAIQATTPKYFQIREVEKRALEFLLDLEAYKREVDKQKVLQEISVAEQKWTALAVECEMIAATDAATVRSLPKSPTAQWPPQVQPYVEIFSHNSTTPLAQAVSDLQVKLSTLETEEIPAAEQISSELSDELQKLGRALEENEVVLSDVKTDIEFDTGEIRSIDARLDAIEDDLHKNQDIERLRKYGATTDLLHAKKGSCPTCHQSVADSLLSQTIQQNVMSVEENIQYLSSQRRTFERMKANIERGLKRKSRKLDALQRRSGDLRSQVRMAKQTLLADGRVPSAAAIRQRVVVEERLEKLVRLGEAFIAKIGGFTQLASLWKTLQARKKDLLGEKLTQLDKNKLARLKQLVVEMEGEFGFDSFPPENLEISYENYLPNRAGFDLVYDVSASDNIRTIAAYLMTLLELARTFETHHPGLLIFDEPRQQSLSWRTFTQVFERAKTSAKFDQQVIIATSEEESRVDYLAADPEINFLNFTGKVLQRINNEGAN